MAKIIPFRPRPRAEATQAANTAACVGNAMIIHFPGAVPSPACTPEPTPAPVRARRAPGRAREKDQRLTMLAKVHIAKKDLMRLPGFDDTVYRDILEQHFGVSSAADLTNRQLHGLLAYFASLGWQAKKGRHRRAAPAELTHDASGMSREDKMGKIEAMLAEKGRVEGTDVPWGYAVTILKNQTANEPGGQVKSFDKASPKQLDGVIAALYKDAKRHKRRLR